MLHFLLCWLEHISSRIDMTLADLLLVLCRHRHHQCIHQYPHFAFWVIILSRSSPQHLIFYLSFYILLSSQVYLTFLFHSHTLHFSHWPFFMPITITSVSQSSISHSSCCITFIIIMSTVIIIVIYSTIITHPSSTSHTLCYYLWINSSGVAFSSHFGPRSVECEEDGGITLWEGGSRYVMCACVLMIEC